MDISELLSRPHHMNPGSAARYLEGFATAMAAVGHTALTISGYLDSAIHFVDGWRRVALTLQTWMNRPSGHSEHIVANALEAARRREFRAPTQNVFRGSRIIYGNKESSLRFRDQRPQLLHPWLASGIGSCGIGDWRW